MPIQLPVTSCSSIPVVVPDHFKLADSLQLALNQLGDGFFALKGTVTSGPLSGRTLKSLNGEAFPGTGLQVKVRDFVALVDGVVLGDKNKEQLNFETFETLTVTVGTKYIVLTPERVVGSDGFNRPNFARGILSIQADAPAIDTGKIVVARLVIPTGTTQVTTSMIQTVEKPYLADLGIERSERLAEDAVLAAQIGAISGGSDLDATINIAKTNFKVDTLLSVNNNELFNGFVDVFNSGSDIDTGLSDSGYALNINLKRLEVSTGAITNLQGYWKMDEADGNTVLLDELALNDGYFATGTRTAGRLGNGIEGPGTYATVAVNPVDFNTAAQFTYMGWFKTTGAGPVISNVSNTFNDGNGYNYLYVGTNNVQSTYNSFSTATNPLDGNWHHLAWTYVRSSGAFSLYLDGVLVGTTTVVAGFGANYSLFFGTFGSINGNSFEFPGAIDEVAVLDRALSGAELLAIYSTVNLTNPPPTLPVNVISNAHAATFVPVSVMIVAEGTNDITLFASRDNGVTYTACPNNTLTSVAGQPSGTAVRYKVVLPAVTSQLDNIAVFWK